MAYQLMGQNRFRLSTKNGQLITSPRAVLAREKRHKRLPYYATVDDAMCE